jgi:DNA-binding transcriptional MocR family regulator
VTARFRITGRRADAIARSVEQAMAVGELVAGDALPPVRALAESLGVSPTTVAAAYRSLRQRGLAVGEGRRGTHVAGREETPSRLAMAILPGAVNVADGNPDPDLLPDLDPVLKKISFGRGLYGLSSVIPELMEAGRRLLEADGLKVEALAVLSGAMDGIERVLTTQLRPGDKVAVEDPAFAGVLDLLGALSMVPVPVAVDDEGPDPAALQRAIASGVQAFLVTPRAQNPTGAAISARRAAALRKVLDAHPDLLVIEDDHAGAVSGAPLVSLQGGKGRRHVYLRSMAKALGPDVRVALLAASPDLVARVEARQIVGMRWVSRLLQRLVVAALADRQVLAAVSRAEREYAKRRRAVLAALAARGVPATGASGFNVWIPVREEAAALQALAAAGWGAAPGERFRVRSGPGLRVTITRVAGSDADRLADAVASVLRPRRGAAQA